MENNSANKLKRGMLLVFLANAFNLFISLVNGFVLPKLLSIPTYAEIKTFQLYLGFVGVLSLGYADGVYLENGGKSLRNIPLKKISYCRTNTFLFQTIIACLMGAAAYWADNGLFLLLALSIVPVNMTSTYKNIFQATGEFKQYSKLLSLTSISGLIANLILVFVVKTDRPELYIACSVAAFYLVWLEAEFVLVHRFEKPVRIAVSLKDLFHNIKNGITLMLGNFSSIIMTSIDRWFVKGLLQASDFAYYSFAVGIENMIVIFINPVATTMYNYLCVNKDLSKLKKIKNMCGIFSLTLISSAFGVKFIILCFINKYRNAVNVLFILFATEVFHMIIKGIYVNIYKSRKEQARYFRQLIIIILLGAALNTLFYFIFRSNEGFAFATLLSVILWYLICERSIWEIRTSILELSYLMINITAFICLGIFADSILGFLLYVSVLLISSLLMVREETLMLWNYAGGFIKRGIRSRKREKE